MQMLTLAVALVGSGLIVCLRPIHGTLVYFAVLLGYPMYLRVSIDTLDISAVRILVVVLLLRCVLDRGLLSRFRWNLLDTAVLASMFLYTLPLMFTTDPVIAIENRGGFFLDTIVPYLAIRMCVTGRGPLVTLLKGITVFVVVFAVLAAIEAKTNWTPYKGLGQYKPWEPLYTRGDAGLDKRYGFFRAMGPTGHPIMMGLSFAILAPLIYLLRWERSPWRWLGPAGFAAAAVGVLASLSSGPWLALILVLVCLVMEHAKGLVKPAIYGVLIACIFLELATQKHFYHFLGRFTMNPGTAWYRARLMDVAIDHLPEYWLWGYGLVDPGWGPEIIGAPFTDIVNHYVLLAVQHGLAGLGGFLCVMVIAVSGLTRRLRLSTDPWERSFIWATAVPVVSLGAVFFSVSLFDQPVTLLHVTFALCGCLYVSKGSRGLDTRWTT